MNRNVAGKREISFFGSFVVICLQDIDFRLLRYNNIVEGYNICAGIFLNMGDE